MLLKSCVILGKSLIVPEFSRTLGEAICSCREMILMLWQCH